MNQNTQKEWENKFYDKFGDKEGCQNFGEDCGTKADVSGQFLCSICEKWGGQEGIVKDFKRPNASIKQIKQFISSLLAQQRNELIKEIEEELPEIGIKWMQEGHNKTRIGYTDGFNQALQDVEQAIKRSERRK